MLPELSAHLGLGLPCVDSALFPLSTKPSARRPGGPTQKQNFAPDSSGRCFPALQTLTALSSTRHGKPRLLARAQAQQASSQPSFPDSFGENFRLRKLSHLQVCHWKVPRLRSAFPQ